MQCDRNIDVYMKTYEKVGFLAVYAEWGEECCIKLRNEMWLFPDSCHAGREM